MSKKLKPGTKCSEIVWTEWHPTYGSERMCSRNATTISNGKPFCTQHAPDAMSARKEARQESLRGKVAQHFLGIYGSSLFDALDLFVQGKTRQGKKAAIPLLKELHHYRNRLR